jgi:hypothetical protein
VAADGLELCPDSAQLVHEVGADEVVQVLAHEGDVVEVQGTGVDPGEREPGQVSCRAGLTLLGELVDVQVCQDDLEGAGAQELAVLRVQTAA